MWGTGWGRLPARSTVTAPRSAPELSSWQSRPESSAEASDSGIGVPAKHVIYDRLKTGFGTVLSSCRDPHARAPSIEGVEEGRHA